MPPCMYWISHLHALYLKPSINVPPFMHGVSHLHVPPCMLRSHVYGEGVPKPVATFDEASFPS